MKAGGDPPAPEPPWEYPRISAALHRQAWGLTYLFLAGSHSWVFFFGGGSSCQSQGGVRAFPRKKGDRDAPVFTWNTVSKTLAAVMKSPSALFCCSGDYDCLATTCSVLGSFTGPDTLFLLLKHFHSTLNIYYVNERYIGMYPWLIFIAIPCQHRVYYDWLPLRALCSRIPCLVLPTSIDLWCHFFLF